MKKNKKMLLTILVINILIFMILVLSLSASIKYIKIEEPLKLLLSIVLFFLPTYIAIIMYTVAKKNNSNIKIVFFILNLLSFVFCLINAIFFNLSNIIISETTNIQDYKVFDKYLRDIDSIKIFPTVIPSSAKNIKYFYRYRRSLDVDYDIYLDITLPEAEYIAEKNRIGSYDEIEITNSTYYTNRIDYRFRYSYIDLNNLNNSYFVVFVSFSDEDFNVRYVISRAMDPSNENTPYFLENNKN